MNRRNFNGIFWPVAGAAAMSGWLSKKTTWRKHLHVKPKKLSIGDKVGLIAPASPISMDRLERAKLNIESLGLVPVYSQNVRLKDGYLAGRDQDRVNDIHAMFANPDIKAIWCVRGGYGVTRILDKVDFNLIRRNPKIIIGYSDITALLQAIYLETGMVTFHGPVASSELSNYNRRWISSVLMSQDNFVRIPSQAVNEGSPAEAYQARIIKSGECRGELIGGNLTLLASLCGTRWGADFTGKLVFIEDVGERPYRLDRMLTQLLSAGNLGQAAGIILGIFDDCEPKPGETSMSLLDMLTDRLGGLDIPVWYGFPFGHVTQQCVLPVGISAEFSTRTGYLNFKESAVS